MADHDQRLKVTLRECLAELVGLMIPAWQPRFDFAQATWLQQELFLNPPGGERRILDLVARLPVNQPVRGSDQVVLHLEIESGDAVADLRGRMPRYHDALTYQHNLPVLSLALYLQVGLGGIGWDGVDEAFWEESLGGTRWPYLGLPALDALVYVEGENLLGVAFSSLMRVPDDRRAWLKARALQRLAEAELTNQRRFLLMDFVEAYLPLEGPHLDEFRHLLTTKEFAMALKIGKTSFEKGIEKGIEKGERELVRKQLTAKFGPLSPAVNARVDAMSPAQLDDVGLRILKADTLAELGLDDPATPHTNGA